MSVESPTTRQSRRHPRVIEVALTLGATGVLFVIIATAYAIAHSAHLPANHSQGVGTVAPPTVTPNPTASIAAALNCSVLSTTVIYNVYQLDPAGSTSPRVSCLTAAATAEAACPLNVRPCVGAPLPETAQLSLIKDFPGSNIADPPRLVWAVTWNLATCSLPKATAGIGSPEGVTPATSGGFIPAQGSVSGCRWVTFIDASTPTELFASMQT